MGVDAASLNRAHAAESVRVYSAVIGQAVISSFTYICAFRAMKEIHPLNLLTVRIVLSGFVYFAVLLATPGKLLPPPRALPTLALFGLLAGPLNQGLFLFGLDRSTPAHAALLYALTPVGVYLLSLLAGREQSERWRLFGIAFAFAGVTLTLLGRGLAAELGPMVGDLFILGAVAAWVVYTTEGKRFAAEHGPIRTTAWTMCFSALWCVPAAPFTVRVAELRLASATAWGCVAFLVLLTSVLSYLLYYYALSKRDASTVAVFANLQPVLTAVAAWWLFGQKIGWEFAVGTVLVIAGVRLAQTRRVLAPPPS